MKKIYIRFLRMIALLLGLALLIFILAYFSPIDPIQAYLAQDANVTPEQVANLREHWGLDKPLYQQFFRWLSSILQGDFGISRLYHAPVLSIVKQAFLNSFMLMMVSWIFSGVLGFILGSLAAFHHGGKIDRFIRWYSYTLVSVPANVMGLVLLIIFGVWFRIFPVGLSSPIGILYENVTFLQRLHHFILPALTLTFLGIAYSTMHTRRLMITVLNSDYVLFAKARGDDSWQIFKKHVFKNSVIPVTIVQFAGFGELFGGSALAENVFAYHGLGSVMTQAGLKGDLPLLLGTALISSLFVFCGNTIADVLSEILDPRIAMEEAFDE
ncbi:ABC transporter permease [Fusobacterium necrophorum]|uniref:ABC transporter permease n=1 Tax=Fusobacterium necrophorum TaxID=859 RepID=UPI00254C13B8|nr:ABC transporter permease [Fusobacterium necrophorum]MDK4501316.1 ABC transporter permease [Fusobacterium necrophorum]